ncbi:hypothetical protein A4G19_08530 [Pasteurellaceae bacterium Macca]|nr:hypothetical protein [Pasteurellaceae bacterium Macca]
MRVYAQKGDTLDLLVYRHFGKTAGLVEQTLELNPHLARTEPLFLAEGTLIELPQEASVAPSIQPIIQLWS